MTFESTLDALSTFRAVFVLSRQHMQQVSAKVDRVNGHTAFHTPAATVGASFRTAAAADHTFLVSE